MTATATKERGIIFSGPMVRALLAGRKTMTRRIMKPQPTIGSDKRWYFDPPLKFAPGTRVSATSPDRVAVFCPHGQPGDRLWVRETWGLVATTNTPYADVGERLDGEADLLRRDKIGMRTVYRADEDGHGWRSPIHMPRACSRITLGLTAVRVERVQDIGKDGRKAQDVLAEGIEPGLIEREREWFHKDDAPAVAFSRLWESINGTGSWAANPFVWVLTFKPAE